MNEIISQKYIKFSYQIIIKEAHLDTFGHVNNATYLQLFEEARWEFITQRGYGLNKIKSSKLGPVILECRIKFKKEIGLRELITINSETIRYDKITGTMKQVMINSEEQICCEAEMIFGLFDTEKRKLVTPTEEWLAAIGESNFA